MYHMKHPATMATLYHNPRCSKSRQALALCEASDMEVDVRLYLSNPLSLDEITSLLLRFDGKIQTTVRTKDHKFKLSNSENLDFDSIPSVAEFLASNGHLMERPILDNGSISCVGRPLDALQRLL